jgi:signal transduction histidine kinase
MTVVMLLVSSCKNDKKAPKKVNPAFEKLLTKAETFYNTQALDSALVYYYRAKSVCTPEELDNLSYTLYFIAEIQRMQCDFSGSEATATESLRINPNYNQNFSFYNILSLNYLEQNDFEEALKYYKLCYQGVKTELNRCIVKNNMGYVHLKSKEYAKAKTFFESIVSRDSLIADPLHYAKVLDNLGFAYFKLNQPQSIEFLNRSLKIRDSLKNDSESIASYIHLSEYYQSTNAALARDFAQKAYNSATAINSPDDRLEALKFLINNSEAKAIKALSLKQMAISDSIAKVRQNSKTQFAKLKYDYSIASKESEKQKSQKQLYLSLFLFISVLSAVSYVAVRSRNKRKLLEATYETETRISKKLHDELANDVFNAMTYADTQNLDDESKKEFLVENLDKIYNQARNISKENSPIDTGENFGQVLKDMLTSYNSKQVNVILKENIVDWSKIKKEAKIIVYRSLQELMVNMKKHSECNIVVITIASQKNHLEIQYSDNGKGCSELLKFKKGLQNVENRIFSINGTITFETDAHKGFKSKVIIPK